MLHNCLHRPTERAAWTPPAEDAVAKKWPKLLSEILTPAFNLLSIEQLDQILAALEEEKAAPSDFELQIIRFCIQLIQASDKDISTVVRPRWSATSQRATEKANPKKTATQYTIVVRLFPNQ